MRNARACVTACLVASMVLVAVFVSSAAGSGRSEATKTKVAAVETITFTGSDSPETYKPVIAAFEQAHPDINVKYTQIPAASFDSTLLQRLQAKDKSIDVFTVDQPTIAQFAASGVLSDMSSLSSAAKSVFPADQYQVNFFQGKMWALPVWTSTGLLFYNKAALKKAGVSFPSADPSHPLTWQQLKALAATVQKRAGIKWGFVFENNPAGYASLLAIAASAGGGTGVTGSDGLGADLDNSGWQKALNWYQGMIKARITPRGAVEGDNYFASGKVAFVISGPWSVGGYLPGSWAPAKQDWGVAPYPKFAGGKAKTPTGAWSWSYNPVSDHKQANLEFIRFASLSCAGNLATVKFTTIIPSSTCAAAKYLPTLQKSAGTHGAGLAKLIKGQSNTAFARPVTVGYVQLNTIMSKAIADISNGAAVPARLSKANSDVAKAFSRLK